MELPIKTSSDPDQAMATYAARRAPSPATTLDMQYSSDSTDPDLAMASYAARRSTPSPSNGLRILAQFDSTGLNSSAMMNQESVSSPTSVPDTLKVITTKSLNRVGSPIKTSPDPDQAMATYAARRAPSPATTLDMQFSSDSTDPDLAMASYAARRSTPSPSNGLRILAQFDSTGLNSSAMMNQESTVSSPIVIPDTLKVWDDDHIQLNRFRTSPALPLIPEHDPQQMLLYRSKSKTNRSRAPTKFGKTLPNRPDNSILSKSSSTRELTRKLSHPQVETVNTPIPQSRRSNSMSEFDRSSHFTLVDQSNISNDLSFSNSYTEIVKPILTNIPKINEPSFLNSDGPVRRPPPRMPLSGTMSSGGVRNSSFVR
ncbi:hypothetical protein CROQUDRAFT_553819 [Cronartium quercuum f. sp. fusiforme G11]|uniref:Uncharacterized protein n=1 Tax=Cronartium quercuum f. sp. fusiforme G11 TaxID=708437 RepID=A0A9P6TCP3_9BASI|nr:hypothetical protein CROQUDRAFT_553819 [Cronartium quercuum f. sp. fusiforme G11]